MPNARTYESESKKLVKAIDIAVEAFTVECPKIFSKEHQEHFISTYLQRKESILKPQPKFKTLASLKYEIENVFTYFQEGTGPTVEYFWNKINEQKIDYTRENKLKKILERGKIKGRIEFEYVIDMFVVAQQNGMITHNEALNLRDMIEVFEKRK